MFKSKFISTVLFFSMMALSKTGLCAGAVAGADGSVSSGEESTFEGAQRSIIKEITRLKEVGSLVPKSADLSDVKISDNGFYATFGSYTLRTVLPTDIGELTNLWHATTHSGKCSVGALTSRLAAQKDRLDKGSPFAWTVIETTDTKRVLAAMQVGRFPLVAKYKPEEHGGLLDFFEENFGVSYDRSVTSPGEDLIGMCPVDQGLVTSMPVIPNFIIDTEEILASRFIEAQINAIRALKKAGKKLPEGAEGDGQTPVAIFTGFDTKALKAAHQKVGAVKIHEDEWTKCVYGDDKCVAVVDLKDDEES